ncbi:MAG: hypothetical protein AAF721_12880 [Myxococcota bacterium]
MACRIGVVLGVGAFALASAGCSNRLLGGGFEEGDADAGSSGSDDGAITSGPLSTSGVMTGPVTTMTPPGPGEDGVPPDPSGDPPMPTTMAPTATTSEPPPPPGALPNGAQCTEDSECASLNCFVAGVLGGICGECNEDADCPGGGCSPPNPLTSEGSVCNAGGLADGCETDDVCAEPLLCALIIDVPGVITASTCSQCESDAECGPDLLCSPSYEVADITGFKACVQPLSVPNGEGCDFAGSGDQACASGFCSSADLMGLLQLGVCGECEVGADCVSGVCNPATIELDAGLIASSCG